MTQLLAHHNMFTIPPIIGIGFQADITPPSTPTNFTLTNVSSDVLADWDQSTDNVAVSTYSLDRQIDGESTWSFISVINHPTSEFTDATVSSSTTYNYRVRAVDSSNNASAYALAQITTLT